jgi:hypothetical protein
MNNFYPSFLMGAPTEGSKEKVVQKILEEINR